MEKTIMGSLKKRQPAILKAKRRFNNTCAFCGPNFQNMQIDGAHIFDASRYPSIANCEYNIIPLCRKHHNGFDRSLATGNKRSEEEKIEWLYFSITNTNYNDKLNSTLLSLSNEINRKVCEGKTDLKSLKWRFK